ncbi:GD17943, partial [Drosophila simulans]
ERKVSPVRQETRQRNRRNSSWRCTVARLVAWADWESGVYIVSDSDSDRSDYATRIQMQMQLQLQAQAQHDGQHTATHAVRDSDFIEQPRRTGRQMRSVPFRSVFPSDQIRSDPTRNQTKANRS